MPDPAAPTALRFDHHPGPVLGIGSPSPRLSWAIPDAPDGWRQTRYEVEVTRQATENYEVASGEQILVPWPAAPLR